MLNTRFSLHVWFGHIRDMRARSMCPQLISHHTAQYNTATVDRLVGLLMNTAREHTCTHWMTRRYAIWIVKRPVRAKRVPPVWVWRYFYNTHVAQLSIN